MAVSDEVAANSIARCQVACTVRAAQCNLVTTLLLQRWPRQGRLEQAAQGFRRQTRHPLGTWKRQRSRVDFRQLPAHAPHQRHHSPQGTPGASRTRRTRPLCRTRASTTCMNDRGRAPVVRTALTTHSKRTGTFVLNASVWSLIVVSHRLHFTTWCLTRASAATLCAAMVVSKLACLL